MKKNIFKYFVIFVLLAFGSSVFAQSDNIKSSFKSFKDISGINIKVPTVVEVSFVGEDVGRRTFAVYENETGVFIPSFFNIENKTQITPFSVSSDNAISVDKNLTDGKYDTFADYPLPETYKGFVEFKIEAPLPITASSLRIFLANNVALPTSIEIRTYDVGSNSIVLAKTRMKRTIVTFPQTTARKWNIKMEYSQPLRIAEMALGQKINKNITKGLRFLAQPGNTYRVYYNPDRAVQLPKGEAPNLREDKGVVRLKTVSTQENPVYTQADIDKDGVPDKVDNCVSVANSNQEDVDNNGRGDACDDFDRDGVINSKDNCPNKPNLRQTDIDGDGIGDVCDGEESRVTEKYTWLPWAGMGFAILVVFGLFYFTVRDSIKKEDDKQTSKEDTPPTPPVE